MLRTLITLTLIRNIIVQDLMRSVEVKYQVYLFVIILSGLVTNFS